MAVATKINGLYKLKCKLFHASDNKVLVINTKQTSELQKWHNRLGHINIIPLKIILDSNNIKISQSDLKSFVSSKFRICIESKDKIHRQSLNQRHYNILLILTIIVLANIPLTCRYSGSAVLDAHQHISSESRPRSSVRYV